MKISALLGALALLGCETKRTEVVIGIATDLAAPTSLDEVELKIQRDGVLIFDVPPWPIPGPGGGQYILPASFGVFSDDGSEPRIEVDLEGHQNGQTIVLRRAVFSLAKEQTLFMRMALVQACVNNSQCTDAETCVEGQCKAPDLYVTLFADYAQDDEKFVTCSSGTTLRDTSTNQALPMRTPTNTCAMCIEGTCYGPPASGGSRGGSAKDGGGGGFNDAGMSAFPDAGATPRDSGFPAGG